MHSFPAFSLKALRKIYCKVKGVNKFKHTDRLAEYTDEEGSQLIKNGLHSTEPIMLCRFGSVEMNCLLHYESIHQDASLRRKTLAYIKGDTFPFWWDKAILQYMSNNAGFINATPENLERFCERIIEDMRYVDILGTRMEAEEVFKSRMPNAKKIRIKLLAPWNHKNPWSEALENKTVLVVHPYERSIQIQYSKREFLFRDKRILPPFELKTIKAVQSIAQNKTLFNNWFDALHYMEDQISSQTFDVAIIGCGAYGFPLAAYIKRMGKQAVHLGGITQLLFGIMGKRWVNYHPVNSFVNEFWTYPDIEEIPSNFKKVENGCYW